MKRREFMLALGGAAAAWPLAARAQQAGKVMRVGFFGPGLTASATIAPYQAFLAQLRELGLNEGENISVEYIGSKRSRSRNALKVPWHKTPLKRRREILVPASVPPQDARAIRSENRALLVSSIARGRRWLNELITNPTANAESIATRDGCSVRKVNMTISLAFLAPDLVKAAIEGRLPHGMGVVRLADLPAEWSRQHQMLGLAAQ